MKLLTLAKKLDFTQDYEYFDYCLDSYVNGNFSQCEKLFKAMTKKDKKGLITYLSGRDKNSIDFEAYEFYFNLI